MDMQNVIYAVAVLFIMGIVFAILLGVAAKVFAVEVDERVPLVRECLPGANCGGCGFPGCCRRPSGCTRLLQRRLQRKGQGKLRGSAGLQRCNACSKRPEGMLLWLHGSRLLCKGLCV